MNLGNPWTIVWWTCGRLRGRVVSVGSHSESSFVGLHVALHAACRPLLYYSGPLLGPADSETASEMRPAYVSIGDDCITLYRAEGPGWRNVENGCLGVEETQRPLAIGIGKGT